jgi:hypothetical protein
MFLFNWLYNIHTLLDKPNSRFFLFCLVSSNFQIKNFIKIYICLKKSFEKSGLGSLFCFVENNKKGSKVFRPKKSDLVNRISDQQIMSHLSLFEKTLSLYQSRLIMFKKKFKNTNIEQVIVILSYPAISNLVIIAYYWICLFSCWTLV